jgi:hypothetical protein
MRTMTTGVYVDVGHSSVLDKKVELELHLGRNPQNRNSELFLLGGFTRTHHDFPAIVHGIEQHCHFRRPRSELRRAFLDERRELIRCSFRSSHTADVAKFAPERRPVWGWGIDPELDSMLGTNADEIAASRLKPANGELG